MGAVISLIILVPISMIVCVGVAEIIVDLVCYYESINKKKKK